MFQANRTAQLKALIADIAMVQESTAEYVLSRFAPHELLDALPTDFTGIYGLDESKAKQLRAAFQLARILLQPEDAPTIIRSPEDVFQLVDAPLRFQQKEHFLCLFLNTKNHVLAMETLFIGSLNAVVAHPREIFRAAIRYGSAAIICAHNHPSGDPKPSEEDIRMTQRIAETGGVIGIELLDHLIVSAGTFSSLKELALF
jgi:DNA repair protein RadC